jgi:hypothetical protein
LLPKKFIAVGFSRRNNGYKTKGFSPNAPALCVAKAENLVLSGSDPTCRDGNE